MLHLYKNTYNEKKIKAYTVISWTIFVILICSIILTIILWDTFRIWFIFQSIGLLGFLIYFLAWLTQSRLFRSLKEFINSDTEEPLLKGMFNLYIDNKLHLLMKQRGFKYVGLFIRTINEDKTELWIRSEYKKNQYLVELNLAEYKCFYGDRNIDEQDIDDDWVILDRESYMRMSVEDFIDKIYELFEKYKNN